MQSMEEEKEAGNTEKKSCCPGLSTRKKCELQVQLFYYPISHLHLIYTRQCYNADMSLEHSAENKFAFVLNKMRFNDF